MKKQILINTLAAMVISVGAYQTALADEIAPTHQACCSTIFTSAVCCGNSCSSGWFNCSAT
ncbi:MAG TPA: hypothetical protein VN706_06455 [Gemmatimonadaceae bacterium]|nr:hypothetical protein [Gemmatimonadaceae bacterium]